MHGTEAGWALFAQARWSDARDAFAAVLHDHPDDPEALDGLGQSLWWLGERDAAIDSRRDAYVAHRRAGNARAAGGIATYLAGEHRIDGNDAAAAGWLARARRLLADQGTVPQLGWLAIEEAKRASDPAEAERHAKEALDVAHGLADPDVECMALAQLGRAVVRQGRVEEGVALLDEAMTVALGGETIDPLACGDACCTTLVVCDSLSDLQRAAQWCEAVVEFAERRHFTPLQAWCRGIYAWVLVRAGEWDRAEAVLSEALQRRANRAKPAGHTLPLAVLADLRLRQGREDEAQRLLTGLEESVPALAPLVRLHVDQGNPALAQALLDHHASATAGDGDVLALHGIIAQARGDVDALAAVAEELRDAAERLNRADLRAEAARLAGTTAAARGDAGTALEELGEAVARFSELDLPYEAARARLALAEVQASMESPLAVTSARAARDAFDRLGARRDADRAAALLRRLGVAGRVVSRGTRDELTSREREVLGLIAGGLSNAEIASRLVISPKTAEHHVGRVLSKLGARSRAEAAAHAVREGL